MNRMPAVIADDLTGAADAGLQFFAAGLRTRVCIQAGAEDTRDADVIVVNTCSRNMRPGEAAESAARAADSVKHGGAYPFFKKVDSTLRGHIGAELDAVMDAAGLAWALLAPAFPEASRSVVGGYVLADGIPAADAAAGSDPVSPLADSYIPSLVRAGSRRPVLHCSLDDIASGLLPRRVDAVRKAAGILVCDGVSRSDLAAAAGEVMRYGGEGLLAGSAGLAREAARLLVPARNQTATLSPPAAADAVIAVVGSLNPVSRRQAELLIRSGGVPAEATPPMVFAADTRAVKHLAKRCSEAAASGKIPVVLSREPEGMRFDLEGRRFGYGRRETAAAVSRTLAKITALSCASFHTPAVIAAGGDTAQAVLEEFGCFSFDIIGEAAPGIPLSVTRGGKFPGGMIITKAGGFGAPDAYIRAADLLRSFSSKS